MATGRKKTGASLASMARAEDEMIERMARLEERHASLSDKVEANYQATLAVLREQSTVIDSLNNAMYRYRGFWGAITLVASAVSAALYLLKEFVMQKLGAN